MGFSASILARESRRLTDFFIAEQLHWAVESWLCRTLPVERWQHD
jgi:hypothetical protein